MNGHRSFLAAQQPQCADAASPFEPHPWMERERNGLKTLARRLDKADGIKCQPRELTDCITAVWQRQPKNGSNVLGS